MADKAITDLTQANSIGLNDLFVLGQGGIAKKLTGQTLVTELAAYLDGHGGIADDGIQKTGTSGLTDTYTITFADETTTTFEVTNGKGISNVSFSSSTYKLTITFNDGTTFTTPVSLRGEHGVDSYTFVRYSDTEPDDDADIKPEGSTGAWMGIYSGTSSTAPIHYTDYDWYKIKGDTGEQGDLAEINSVTAQYQFHTDGAVAPSGTWYNSVPAASAAVSGETQGKYLWSKIDITYNTSQHSVFYSTAYQGIDGTGLTGVVKSVNSTLTPDGNGNVDVTASGVGAIPAPVAPSDGAVLMFDTDDGWIAGDATQLGTVKSVNGKNPDGNGNVTLTFSDVKPSSGIEATDIKQGALAYIYYNTIPRAAWDEFAGLGWKYEVSVSPSLGIKQGDAAIPTVYTLASWEIFKAAEVYTAIPHDNSLTLYAKNEPTGDIGIRVIVFHQTGTQA